jgi:hypothetical protein
MSVTNITRLELRTKEIPRSHVLERLEDELGRPLTHETRHYLAGRPVHCGDLLEIYIDEQWVLGRYEWTGKPEELPTLKFDADVMRIDDECLVRWPMKWKPRGK